MGHSLIMNTKYQLLCIGVTNLFSSTLRAAGRVWRDPFLILCVSLLAMLGSGCSTFYEQNAILGPRLTEAPAGKALVNFHQPSISGGHYTVPIFNENGEFIGAVEATGATEFQWVCEPGEHFLMGWLDKPLESKNVAPTLVVLPKEYIENVAVLKTDVAADKVYDVLVEVKVGWLIPKAELSPLSKENPKRKKVTNFERGEKLVSSGMQATAAVAQYKQEQQRRVTEVTKDFGPGGSKSDRVRYLRKEDSR